MLGTRTWGDRMVGYGGIPSDLLGQVFPTTQDFNMVENVILPNVLSVANFIKPLQS